MSYKSKEAEEFNRLQELGFKFGAPDEYASQPDSSSTIGGIIGIQEYGIVGDIATEEICDENAELVGDPSDVTPEPHTTELSGLNNGGLHGEYGATSEWSTTHALEEEDIVEKQSDAPSSVQSAAVQPSRGQQKRAKRA